MIYLYLCALVATLFGYGTPFVNIVAPYFFYSAYKKKPSLLQQNPFILPVLVFTFWLLLVTLYWKNFLGLLAGTFAILPTVFLFLYTVQVLNRDRAYDFLKILVMLSTLAAPVALYQQYIIKVSIYERAFATFGNANFYASYLLMIIPAAFALALKATKPAKKYFYFGIMLLNVYCLLLTNSRTAIAALFIAFILFAMMTKNYRLLSFTVFVTASLVVAVFLKPELIPRYHIIFSEFQERISIWSLGWHAISEHPIIGTGLTSFYTQYVMNYPGKYAPHAHNLFLNIWIEGGIIALSLLMWNLGKIYRLGYKKITSSKNVLIIGVLVGLTAALIQSFLDNPLENFQTGTVFAFFVALLLKL